MARVGLDAARALVLIRASVPHEPPGHEICAFLRPRIRRGRSRHRVRYPRTARRVSAPHFAPSGATPEGVFFLGKRTTAGEEPGRAESTIRPTRHDHHTSALAAFVAGARRHLRPYRRRVDPAPRRSRAKPGARHAHDRPRFSRPRAAPGHGRAAAPALMPRPSPGPRTGPVAPPAGWTDSGSAGRPQRTTLPRPGGSRAAGRIGSVRSANANPRLPRASGVRREIRRESPGNGVPPTHQGTVADAN